ncbi:MAG: NRDE family protein [Proteobacteria bacterium]|nr:NRDE family protein [Pseudomonadota bacterium]
MCLILFAWRTHANFPLVLAANRDEFYERPAAPAAFWDDAPELLAGRDLKEGGTWLGITRTGRVAALTNYRDPATLKKDAPSRGNLVSDYLRGRETPEDYLRRLESRAGGYNGFSLIVGDADDLFYFSNRGGRRPLTPGIHGLSNRLLDTPWPKIERGKRAFEALLEENREPLPEELLDLLAERMRPPDELLPETGVGLEWERILSPLFIESPVYGTRSSTVVMIDRSGGVTFVERVFNGGNEPRTMARFDFRIKKYDDLAKRPFPLPWREGIKGRVNKK